MKYWIEGNQIIVITEDSLLFGSYPVKTLSDFKSQLDSNQIPQKLMGIPINYIKTIEVKRKSRKIGFELGKKSVEHIEFDSKKLRANVLEHLIKNFQIFKQSKPTTSKIWKSYIRVALIITISFLLMLTLNDFTGSITLSRQAIGHFMTWFTKTFSNQTIFIIGSILLIWRTIILIIHLKENPHTIILTRK